MYICASLYIARGSSRGCTGDALDLPVIYQLLPGFSVSGGILLLYWLQLVPLALVTWITWWVPLVPLLVPRKCPNVSWMLLSDSHISHRYLVTCMTITGQYPRWSNYQLWGHGFWCIVGALCMLHAWLCIHVPTSALDTPIFTLDHEFRNDFGAESCTYLVTICPWVCP